MSRGSGRVCWIENRQQVEMQSRGRRSLAMKPHPDTRAVVPVMGILGITFANQDRVGCSIGDIAKLHTGCQNERAR